MGFRDIEPDVDIPNFGLEGVKCPHCGSSKFAVHGEVRMRAMVDVEYTEEQGAYEEEITGMETANEQTSSEQSVFEG